MFAMGLVVAVGPVAVIGGGISLLARRVRSDTLRRRTAGSRAPGAPSAR